MDKDLVLRRGLPSTQSARLVNEKHQMCVMHQSSIQSNDRKSRPAIHLLNSIAQAAVADDSKETLPYVGWTKKHPRDPFVKLCLITYTEI